MDAPILSSVVLTRNEEANVADALESLLVQDGVALEVIVVDSASTDATVRIARDHEARHGDRLRVIASSSDIPIGQARNLGFEHARGRIIAQMSADATAAPGWAREMVSSLETSDVVYGRQEHAPPHPTIAATVRGLRYHHFDEHPRLPPEAFASNVNAGIRREVLDRIRYVDDGPASALDDILFTHEAQRLGYRIAYNPRMVVRHKDATTLRQEFTKNKREGYGWGLLAPRLGLHAPMTAWGGSLCAGTAAVAASPLLPLLPTAPLACALLGLAYAPTIRRVVRAGGRFAARQPGRLAAAACVGPAFDLAFLFHYMRGLRARRSDLTGVMDGAPSARQPHSVASKSSSVSVKSPSLPTLPWALRISRARIQ